MLASLTIPALTRNVVSLAGMVIATTTAVVFLVLVVLQSAGLLQNPYVGLVIYVAVPIVFVAGLLLIPAGAWWHAGRRPEERGWPVIDLGQPRQRLTLAVAAGLTIANLFIVSLSAYGGVHYMESAEFCGQTCHTTMRPQAVAHRDWPHAAVACAQCHVGSGAGAFVEAKLAGTRQLYKVMTGDIPRPVRPPARLIQSSTTTCQTCHSPGLRAGDRIREIRSYAGDEANTESITRLQLRVGDLSGGIHRHIALRIEYVAADDAAGSIPVVRVLDASGRVVREFVNKSEGAAAGGHTRRMECTDCHNRPAHTFDFSAERAVDRALAQGRLPRELAFVRREALGALEDARADASSAPQRIERRLRDFYAPRTDANERQVRAAIDGTLRAWNQNIFPAMRVDWGTYPNHLGHVDSPGCFRCHDDTHTSADGVVIKQDCELCHTFPD